jgi:hypothetical protein
MTGTLSGEYPAANGNEEQEKRLLILISYRVLFNLISMKPYVNIIRKSQFLFMTLAFKKLRTRWEAWKLGRGETGQRRCAFLHIR